MILSKRFILLFILLIAVNLFSETVELNINLQSSVKDYGSESEIGEIIKGEIENFQVEVLNSAAEVIGSEIFSIPKYTDIFQAEINITATEDSEQIPFLKPHISPNPIISSENVKFNHGINSSEILKIINHSNLKQITTNAGIEVYNLRGAKIAETERAGTLKFSNKLSSGIYFIKTKYPEKYRTRKTKRDDQYTFRIQIDNNEDEFMPLDEIVANGADLLLQEAETVDIKGHFVGTQTNEDLASVTLINYVPGYGTLIQENVPYGEQVKIFEKTGSFAMVYAENTHGFVFNSNRETSYPDYFAFAKNLKDVGGKRLLFELLQHEDLTKYHFIEIINGATGGSAGGVGYHWDGEDPTNPNDDFKIQIQYKDYLDPEINLETAIQERQKFVDNLNKIIKHTLGYQSWTEDNLLSIDQETAELIKPNDIPYKTERLANRIEFLEEGEPFQQTNVAKVSNGGPSCAVGGYHPDYTIKYLSISFFFSQADGASALEEMSSIFAPYLVNDNFLQDYTIYGFPSSLFPIDNQILNLTQSMQQIYTNDDGLIVGHPTASTHNLIDVTTNDSGDITNIKREYKFGNEWIEENYANPENYDFTAPTKDNLNRK